MNTEENLKFRQILDIPQTIEPAKVYDKKSRFYNQEYWIIHCINNIVRIHPSVFTNFAEFRSQLESGFLLGKKCIFYCNTRARGNQVNKIEFIEESLAK